MRRRQQPHICLTPGCGRSIERWKRLCNSCWCRLPFDQRKAIAAAMSDRATHIVTRLAAAAAEWLTRHSPAAEAARRLGERE